MSMLSSSFLSEDDLWNIATAIVCAVACAIPGCFLMLRRLSLLGDALSHSILPGIAVAFLLTGSRDAVPMLAGAVVAALVTVFISRNIEVWGRVPEDSALGVAFTSLFALGVVLISGAARHVDIDPGCVLYGSLEFVSFDRITVFGVDLPRVFVTLMIVLVSSITLISLFFKELTLVTFDPTLARTLGFYPAVVGTVFVLLVSSVIVASFEAVGSILVVTMLVAPAATAHLISDRLKSVLFIAVGHAVLSAVLGYLAAMALNTSVAGMISVISCVLFVAAVCLAPRYGLASRLVRRWNLLLRITKEDILGVLYRVEERTGRADSVSSGTLARVLKDQGSGAVRSVARIQLLSAGLIKKDSRGDMLLSQAGRVEAQSIVRGHRLWETYLEKFLGLPSDHLHEPSDKVEHYLSAPLQTMIQKQVKQSHDPHGSKIPEEMKSDE